MPIPDFQSLMRPLLMHLEDGAERTTHETVDALAAHFGLTEDERKTLMPSGKGPLLVNRIAWAKLHLKRARLLESPGRGVYRITARGQEFLLRHPDPINLRLLHQFEEYRAFRARRANQEPGPEPVGPDQMTPEEHIEYGHEQIRNQLTSDILDHIRQCPPDFFERLVVELLVAMGYGGSRRDAGQAVGRGADGGVDGIIKEDRLGLDTIYIQAKRWDGPVGRPEVQKFAGALQGFRARKGIFITTSAFTKDAQQYVSQIDSKIVLIDGNELAAHMIDHSIGVTTSQIVEIKRLDSDYFVSPE